MNIPPVAPSHPVTPVHSSTDEKENTSPVLQRGKAGSMDNESIKFVMRYWEELMKTQDDIREKELIQGLKKRARNGELGEDSTAIADAFLHASDLTEQGAPSSKTADDTPAATYKTMSKS